MLFFFFISNVLVEFEGIFQKTKTKNIFWFSRSKASHAKFEIFNQLFSSFISLLIFFSFLIWSTSKYGVNSYDFLMEFFVKDNVLM